MVETTIESAPGAGSGVGKLCESILCAICVAPIVLLLSSFLLGKNEQMAVCQTRANTAAHTNVKEMGCNQTGNGDLVLFSCDMKDDGLTLKDTWAGYTALQGFLPSSFEYVGSGLSVNVEMLQCMEKSHSESHKRSDGSTVTTTTYTYYVDWAPFHVDVSAFHEKHQASYNQNCGSTLGANPEWPNDVPMGDNQVWAPEVKVGAYTLDQWLVEQIPIDKPLAITTFKSGWTHADAGTFMNDHQSKHRTAGIPVTDPGAEIGKLRVKFLGTDWSKKKLTVLGHDKAARISKWKSPPTWLCSPIEMYHISRRAISKEDLFQEFQDEADTILILLRIVGFCMMWCGWAMFGKPLGAFLDLIPCCGTCLGDVADMITCAIACLPATACCMLVAGIVWVAMRPMVGIPLILVAMCIIGFLALSKQQADAKKEANKSQDQQIQQQPLNQPTEN